MTRPLNKKELIEFSEDKFKTLIEKIKSLSDKDVLKPLKNKRSAKDNLGHVLAWQLLTLEWYKKGMKSGERPKIPIPGLTWKDTPVLNEKFDKQYKKLP